MSSLNLYLCHCASCRVVMSLGIFVTVAVTFARTVLPRAVRLLALHATDELYQLTIIAFCLVGSWISGRLVRRRFLSSANSHRHKHARLLCVRHHDLLIV